MLTNELSLSTLTPLRLFYICSGWRREAAGYIVPRCSETETSFTHRPDPNSPPKNAFNSSASAKGGNKKKQHNQPPDVGFCFFACQLLNQDHTYQLFARNTPTSGRCLHLPIPLLANRTEWIYLLINSIIDRALPRSYPRVSDELVWRLKTYPTSGDTMAHFNSRSTIQYQPNTNALYDWLHPYIGRAFPPIPCFTPQLLNVRLDFFYFFPNNQWRSKLRNDRVCCFASLSKWFDIHPYLSRTGGSGHQHQQGT